MKKRILFVDDDPNLIEGLRRALRSQREVWDMEFVAGGAQALTCMAAAPFDVLVTDMHMPGMDGAELLERVLHDYPSTARIVLTGHADESLTRRAINLAHRCLAKPTDAETLCAAVSESCGAQQIVQDEPLRALVSGCGNLPSAPALYMEITRAAESEMTDARAIGRILSKDMAMCAKILQVVNSSFFGLARRVSSIEQTVSLLGVTRIKALVLSEHLFRQFTSRLKPEQLGIERLWEHSMVVAEIARAISRAEGQTGDRPDQAFTAGLLHDVGLLVLAASRAESLETVCRTAREQSIPMIVLERDEFGVTHAQVGAYLLRLWGLPPRIVEGVALHHEPSRVEFEGMCAVTAVHVADVLERTLLRDQPTREDMLDGPLLDEAYLARIGLTGRLDEWRKLAPEMRAKLKEIAA